MDQQVINHKQKSHRKISNQMDKICSKLQISVKNINSDDTLSKSVKQKIQKYIESDDINNLQSFLDKKVLSYEVQIGIKSMKWNIVHFSAKNNSSKILQVILTKTYQQSPDKYRQLINTQTSQGYTPLMISVIYSAKESFLLLLELGGSNIQCQDNKKMTAYDLALNYKNQFAIRQLMSYQSNNKRKGDTINEELLLKPIDPMLYSSGNCYSKMFDCFIDCFLCFKHNQNEDIDFDKQNSDLEKQNIQQSFLRKSVNGSKLMSLLKYNQENQLDFVSIGNKQIESKYSIQWKRLSTAINQKGVLFDCFQPFDICQNNLIIANNLIIFQCLSDHTWMIRKILKQLKKGQGIEYNNSSNVADFPNQYAIELYFNDQLKKITVDEYIPFLKQRQEPMFLSNLNEMWPQILQKGLAKIYGSYMKLSEIKPITFVQNLTGSYTKSYSLQDGMNFLKNNQGQFIKDKTIMTLLQDFSAKGYLVLLQGRQGTTLSPKNSPTAFKNYCYTILNFYEKGSKKLILVNCPYVLNSWKQKQKSQIMQLKLIKSHYNSHNQMCVWIEENQFAHFFKNIIISFTEPNMIRSQMKIRYLLETEIEKKQESKLKTVLQNITNSAKSIFSSKNQKRQSVTSNTSALKNGSQRDSSISINLPHTSKGKHMKKLVFVKFKIQNSKNSESFSLAIKDNVSHLSCKINKFKGWIDGGTKDISLQDNNIFSPDLLKIKQKKGQYLCMFEVEFMYYSGARESIMTEVILSSEQKFIANDKENMIAQNKFNKTNEIQKSIIYKPSLEVQKTIKKHQLLVVCWSQDFIQLQHIEEEFAVIDCLQSWRKNTIKNWLFLDKKQNGSQLDQSIKFVTQKIGQKFIIMTKSSKDLQLSFSIEGNEELKRKIHDLVHEGNLKGIDEIKKNEQTNMNEYNLNVQLVRDSQHNQFNYVVLSVNEDILLQLQKCNFNLSVNK